MSPRICIGELVKWHCHGTQPGAKNVHSGTLFDANWDHIIAVFPRYQELLDLRGGTDAEAIAAAVESYTEQDFRDLQIWFNLAWVDPDYLAQEPFKALVDKGRDFSEEDKIALFEGIYD